MSYCIVPSILRTYKGIDLSEIVRNSGLIVQLSNPKPKTSADVIVKLPKIIDSEKAWDEFVKKNSNRIVLE